MEKQQIYLDPTDFESMISLMDKYGDSKYPYFGENEDGEMVSISIFPDKIVTMTYQSNGWHRKNVYWRDGTREELFEGRDEV